MPVLPSYRNQSIGLLCKFKRIDLETIYHPRFPNLIKFKVSLQQEKATEIESIDFVGCYTTRLKDDIYAVTNISVEISVRVQTFIPVKVSLFLKGI